MSNYEIYHNPRCSKSRATLKLLEENGIEPKVRLYLEEPPSAAELKKVLKALNLSARKIIREGEDEFRSEKLADKSLTDADLIAAMLKHPRLIQRPIVIRDRKAARIGRPPESVAELWK
ncbi:MAG: arsenate reductase (glutaredoxin) [Verrucomicrobiales bacterium]|mgnify:CR=1 FL=1|nr:arsenate reductase (glutaredoxin) [Verrucomicrobiales bacterium]